jgi:hypothetical protein
MADLDPRLDGRLQSFLDEIKAQRVPPRLAGFRPAAARPGRKLLNFVAGATGIVVIATSIAVFAAELNGHRDTAPPSPGGHATATGIPGPTPTATSSSEPTATLITPTPPSTTVSLRPTLPDDYKVTAADRVLIPVTYGSGSETLPTFTLAPNVTIYVEDGCISRSSKGNSVTLVGGRLFGVDSQYQCASPTGANGASSSSGGYGNAGGRVTVKVEADPSVNWVLLIFEGPPPTQWSWSTPGPTP